LSLDLDAPGWDPHLRRLQPYARRLVGDAGEHAQRLHADAVAPEHLLSILMADPRSAAHAAVLHAFADPATISEEVLAISPGLMVVASGSTLPFSALAVEALIGARAAAEAAGEESVGVPRIFSQSLSLFDEGLRRTMLQAGFSGEIPDAERKAHALDPGLFRHFSMPAKRVLSASNRLAAGDRAPSISHVHLFLGCLQEDEALATRTGVSFRRARLLVAGSTGDPSVRSTRALPPDRAMVAFLEGVPAGSDSLALLARFLAGGTPEAEQILVRSKVTRALLDRARSAFHDPDEVQEGGPARR